MIVRPHVTVARLFVASLALALVASLVPPPHVARAAATDLFFSEYVEGSSNNKALEIFNGTGAAVDLSAGGYNVQQFSNGAVVATFTINLSGTIQDADVFVLAHSSATAPILAVADQTTGLGLFNGNDALVLRHGASVVDVIGQVGFDPGVEWGAGVTSTQDNTLRRKPTVAQGDANGADAFDPAIEWDGFATNDFTGLGAHTFTPGEPTNPSGTGFANPSSVLPGGSTLLTVHVSPGTNPPSTGLAVSANLTAIGGGATQPFYDDGTNGDFTSGDLVFSYAATVAAATTPGVKTMTATITDAQARTGTASIFLTVEAPPTEIWQIQGAGHVSPLNGQNVFDVEGIVTAVSSNSFWMTDPTPDADEATSDGILVFRGTTATKPTVGDHVSVDGRVTEFLPGGAVAGFENLRLTEITTPNSFTVLSSGNPLPVTVVGGGGRIPPSTVIDNDTLPAGAGGDGTIDGATAVTTFDPTQDGIDFYESLEGMYLQVNDALVVGPRNNFGEIAIVGDGGAHAGPFTPRGGLIIGPGDFNPERIILDDVLRPTPFVNVGDGFTTSVAGVLDYSFGNYKLLVTSALVGDDRGLAREATLPAGPHELAVATFNVENLSAVNPQAKFDELAGMIVHNLRAPDLVAIEEIQDDTGATDNGVVTAAATWQRLITAVLAAGGPLYAYRQIDPENNADGGQPGGNIRVGFLFRSDRGLEFVDRPGGDAVTDTDAVATPNGKGARLTISPGRVLPDAGGDFATAFELTRKPLAGEFRWRGETIFVVANHLSSKGDDHPLFGRFQPPVRFTEFQSGDPEDGWRHAQAQVVNAFVDEILAVDGHAHVIVLGDINDFDFSETVGVLTGVASAGAGGPDLDGSGPVTATGEDPVLFTLFGTLPPSERYSYVFEGNSQVLDQILVSESLWGLQPIYDVVHVNSEFAAQASDHDPSVVRIAFQPRRER